MRTSFGCLLVGIAGLVLAPNSQELGNRYGVPDMERFIVQPGISLTVEYGSDHLTCQALIEPPQALFHREETAPLMSPEAVIKTLETIAPESERGKEISRGITASGCNEFQVVEYENVTIMHSMHNCLPPKPDREIQATVSFKRTTCGRSPNR